MLMHKNVSYRKCVYNVGAYVCMTHAYIEQKVAFNDDGLLDIASVISLCLRYYITYIHLLYINACAYHNVLNVLRVEIFKGSSEGHHSRETDNISQSHTVKLHYAFSISICCIISRINYNCNYTKIKFSQLIEIPTLSSNSFLTFSIHGL